MHYRWRRESALTLSSVCLTGNPPCCNNDFPGRENALKLLADLAEQANDPYQVSLPLLMSAKIGDQKTYQATYQLMIRWMAALDTAPAHFPEWMRSTGFKAWMQGRLLVSGSAMNDQRAVSQASKKLADLLNQPVDNLAFTTWAWGYQASLNRAEYTISKKPMLENTEKLTAHYKKSKSHSDLSDAMWSWIMNINAAAMAGDKETYQQIKQHMQSAAEAETIPLALQTGLLRTRESNDYPAWGLSMVRRAAAMMDDQALFRALEKPLTDSIEKADKASAEYGLAVLDNQLASQTALQSLQED